MTTEAVYYQRYLSLVHHLGYGFHADRCAPGILRLLEPVRDRDGLVLELGCGSGLLTRFLVEAGHRVIATDASPHMLELARETAPEAEEIRQLTLPDDPLPACDAVVSIGHVLSYLTDEASLERALVAAAESLRPGGLFALDLCDLRWADRFVGAPGSGRVGDTWAIVSRFEVTSPERFVRHMTTFVDEGDGCWRRDDETHENVLVDTSMVPVLLADHGVEAKVGLSFGDEELPPGLVTIIGTRKS